MQAVRELRLGRKRPDGTADPEAWRLYGFDLDGWSSDASFGAHCRALDGAKKADIRVDGQGGIDNSFGKNAWSFLGLVTPDPDADHRKGIEAGKGTTVLRIHGLAGSGDQTGLTAELFTTTGSQDSSGATVGPSEQQWADGSYAWHPRGDQVGSDGASVVQLTNGHVTGDTWVSGDPATFPVEIFLGEYRLTLTLHRATMMGTLSPDRRSMTAGIAGGILDLDELIEAIRKMGQPVSETFCAFKRHGPYEFVPAWCDILEDGTQDPARNCGAVSVGFGFVTAPASLGAPSPEELAPDPCAGQ